MKFLPPYDESKLFCFSPLVMLLTFIIEFTSAIYILFTTKIKPSAILLILILVSLGTFQLAEYQVCSNKSLLWMRVGYIAITLLPPLGINLVSLVTKKMWHTYVGYGIAAFFVGAFLISTRSVQAAVCGGNYIMVTLDKSAASYYFSYYYYLLLAIGLFNISGFTSVQKDNAARDQLKVSYLFWIAIGYASFLIPTGAVYLLSQSARSGIPSIMCGFAVFLAIILTFRVYPISRKLGI